MFDWRGKNTSQASSVGWGRRIYDQGEIEVHVEDKKLFVLKLQTSYFRIHVQMTSAEFSGFLTVRSNLHSLRQKLATLATPLSPPEYWRQLYMASAWPLTYAWSQKSVFGGASSRNLRPVIHVRMILYCRARTASVRLNCWRMMLSATWRFARETFVANLGCGTTYTIGRW